MPRVSFSNLRLRHPYSREHLIAVWGYRGVQAISRGVVTPARHQYIILFATKEKQPGYQQYRNELQGTQFFWEGPTDHYAEDRLLRSKQSGDEVHLFYRERHHMDFLYLGQIELESSNRKSDESSEFTFRLVAPV